MISGFKTEIKANLHIVGFLYVTFVLLDVTYKPYKKPNDQLLPLNTSWNHPQQIINQLAKSLSDRLSNNSSNKQVFNISKGKHEKASRQRGYKNVSFIYKDKNKIKINQNEITPAVSFGSIHLLTKLFQPT